MLVIFACQKGLGTQTGSNSCINKIEQYASGNGKEQTHDGQTLLLVLEEQADKAQQETDSEKDNTNDIDQRNPWHNKANQRQDETSNAEAVLTFLYSNVLFHFSFPEFVSGATSNGELQGKNSVFF